MNAAEPGIAKDLLQTAALEDAESSRHFQGEIDGAPRALDRVILGAEQHPGPRRAVRHACTPIRRDAIQVRLCRALHEQRVAMDRDTARIVARTLGIPAPEATIVPWILIW